MKKLFLLFNFLLFCLCGSNGFAQSSLNLDFELKDYQKYWMVNDKGSKISVDSLEKYSGKFSLKMERSGNLAFPYSVFRSTLPVGIFAGKQVQLNGRIKTRGVKNGVAGLMFAIYDAEEMPTLSHTLLNEGMGMQEEPDWKQISITLDISKNARIICFGGILSGEGTAWYDDLELYVGGEKFVDFIEPEPKTVLSPKEIAALQKYVYPLRTYEPDGSDNRDLRILDKLVGNSRMVALGEVSHGSSEIFKMKHRIIRYLVENKGFDVFSLEGFMAESYKMNDYVLFGEGDLIKILDENIWCWNTEEMLNLAEWMRGFNQSKQRIQFTGFDMQSYQGALQELQVAFVGDSGLTADLDDLKGRLDSLGLGKRRMSDLRLIEPEMQERKAIDSILLQVEARISQLLLPEPDKNWLKQNVTLIRQYSYRRGVLDISWRDKCMADNVMWIREQNPISKMILWGHNTHIQRSVEKNISIDSIYSVMGSRLAERLGSDYTTFGFAFYEGSFTAEGQNGRGVYPAIQALPGTLEYLLNQLDEPFFILDLKRIKANPTQETRWVLEPLDYRAIGLMQGEGYQGEFLRQSMIANKFDYLIFIKKSTPSVLLSKVSAKGIGAPLSAGLNLDFEDVEKGLSSGWELNGTRSAVFSVDSMQVREGKYAAAVEIREGGSQFGVIGKIIRKNYPGSTITLSGYLKTENVTERYASLFMRIDPEVGGSDVQITGTTDWKRYEVTVKMNPDKATGLAFGVALAGKGKVWVDDLRITIDGKDIETLTPLEK